MSRIRRSVKITSSLTCLRFTTVQEIFWFHLCLYKPFWAHLIFMETSHTLKWASVTLILEVSRIRRSVKITSSLCCLWFTTVHDIFWFHLCLSVTIINLTMPFQFTSNTNNSLQLKSINIEPNNIFCCLFRLCDNTTLWEW